MSYETRTLKIAVCVKGEPIYHEGTTEIEIVDEAAGEFLKITQSPDSDIEQATIKIDPIEWPMLKAGIDKMMKECRSYD
jgi:hypothetical protein